MKKGIIVCACLVCMLFLASCSKENQRELDFSKVTFSDFRVFDAPMRSLRAMATSPKDDALYLGFIQLGSNGVRKLDLATQEVVWTYHDAVVARNTDNRLDEYPKGVASDDRGYVYAVISYNRATYCTLAVINAADGSEVNSMKVEIGPLDSGVNGIAVHRVGNRYLAYFITNYGPNRVYCMDVTDPKNIVANTEFGVNGIVNLAHVSGVDVADANYLAIADDGQLYLTIKLANGSKADSVARLSSDGKTLTKVIDCAEAYGIDIANGYIFVSTYKGTGSVVNVYKLSDYSLVATLAGDVPGHSHYSQVVMSGDRLYIADQAYQTGATTEVMGSRVLVSDPIVALK